MGTSTGDFIDALYLEREYGIRVTVSTILMINGYLRPEI